MGTIRKWKWLSVVLLISMVVSACDFSRLLTTFPGSTATEEPLQETETVKPTLDVQEVAGVEAAPFAQYSQVSYQIPDVFKNDYTLPLDAASVTGLDLTDLTDTQIAALLKNGFVVAPPITDPNRLVQRVLPGLRILPVFRECQFLLPPIRFSMFITWYSTRCCAILKPIHSWLFWMI